MTTSRRIHAWGKNQTLAEYGRQVILIDNSPFLRAHLQCYCSFRLLGLSKQVLIGLF